MMQRGGRPPSTRFHRWVRQRGAPLRRRGEGRVPSALRGHEHRQREGAASVRREPADDDGVGVRSSGRRQATRR